MKNLMILAFLCLKITHSSLGQAAVNNSNPNDSVLAFVKTTLPEDSAAQDEENEDGEHREYKIKLGNTADRLVRIVMASSEIKIIGHNSDEVAIETNTYQTPPARAKGLKALYNSAEDNTGTGLSVKREGNVLIIEKAQKGDGKYTIRIPKKAGVSYTEANWDGGDFQLSDVDGQIELNLNNSGAELINISGPVVANSTNGGIQVKFKSLNPSKPSSISVVNGEVDVTLPGNTKANWKLRSINGEVYTDFDMALPKDKTDLQKIAGSNTVQGKTNGGGVEMNIYTINSDIFIRKSK